MLPNLQVGVAVFMPFVDVLYYSSFPHNLGLPSEMLKGINFKYDNTVRGCLMVYLTVSGGGLVCRFFFFFFFGGGKDIKFF